MDNHKSKIAIISNSLGSGGAERFASVLGFMLERLGYEIHHVIIKDAVDYEYAGQLYNLGKICSNDGPFKRKISKGILLKRYLDGHKIETVIDNRSRNIFIREVLARWIYARRKKIYIVHSFSLKEYFPAFGFLARWLYKDADRLVCVSKAIEAEINTKYDLHNTITIYNPVNLPEAHPVPARDYGKYFLFFGRLDEKVKNFTLMLEAFSISRAYAKGFHLLIMGNGPDQDAIQKEIAKWNLQSHVTMIPFQSNPFGYVKQARFTILTSRHEGFPMAIIESLALGTPVVSVDCQSGPAEIIEHQHNGLLVKNHDAHKLAHAIATFAEEGNLYDICKQNAAASVAHLSVENISQQWRQILSK